MGLTEASLAARRLAGAPRPRALRAQSTYPARVACPRGGGHAPRGDGTRRACPPPRPSATLRDVDSTPRNDGPGTAATLTPVDAPAVEIVSAGNEVLIGDVLDTNTNRLCTLVTGFGGLVTRTVMVRDDLEAIAREVAGAVARRPALVFTVGGLGPTSDDRTLEGVALCIPRPSAWSARSTPSSTPKATCRSPE